MPNASAADCSTEKNTLDDVFNQLYKKIRQLASRVRWNGTNQTLNPTALVHEAYLKLLKHPPDLSSKSYEEVIGVFAGAMRQILIDASRRKMALKRSPAFSAESAVFPIEDALTLGALVEDLKRENPRQGQIVDCRFYLGMTADETAAALDLSTTTVEREFRKAKGQLRDRISNGKVVMPDKI
jgi:RNA polymerase sigma factor (TIGR02999 family)